MNETIDVRLARIEERLHHVVHQLEKIMVENGSVASMQQEVQEHGRMLQKLQTTIQQAKGMAVVISALIAFIATLVPEVFFKH